MPWPLAVQPRTTRSPSAQADDIGEMLTVASGFIVVMRTTGVPKYKIVGLMMMCSRPPRSSNPIGLFMELPRNPFGVVWSNMALASPSCFG
jgi:hypothetical protein